MATVLPDPPPRFEIYVDESSQSGCRYMVLGALIARSPTASELDLRLDEVRDRHALEREMKWGKVSGAKLAAYRDFVGTVVNFLHTDGPGYYAVVIDTSDLDHRRFNGGDREVGFSKFVYQLLVKCGRLFQPGLFDCFLDERKTRQTLSELRKIVNDGLNLKVSVRPIRRMEYRDSSTCNLIQAVDIITGAIAYHWNQNHIVPTANPAKVALATEIATMAGMTHLGVGTRAGKAPFSIWKFATQPNRAPRRA